MLQVEPDGAMQMGRSVALQGGPAGPRYEFDMHRKSKWTVHRADWSLADSELYPFDPAVIKAIREFKPWFVPVVRNTVCVADTGEVAKFVHHGLAYATLVPKLYTSNDPGSPLFKHGLHFRRSINPAEPNGRLDLTDEEIVVERVLEGPRHERSLPGEFRPIGWGVHYVLLHDEYEKRKRLAVEREEAKRLVAEAEKEAAAENAARQEFSERIDHYAPDLLTDLGVRSTVAVP